MRAASVTKTSSLFEGISLVQDHISIHARKPSVSIAVLLLYSPLPVTHSERGFNN